MISGNILSQYMLDQQFSTFWYSSTPKLIFLPICIPPNKNVFQIVTPKQKIAIEAVVSILF